MVAMQKASLRGAGSFGLAVFLPNMLKKDQPLCRYPGFEVYRERPWLLSRGFFKFSFFIDKVQLRPLVLMLACLIRGDCK